jgi:hypothetical protein
LGRDLSCAASSAPARDAYSAVGASTTTKVEPKWPGKAFFEFSFALAPVEVQVKSAIDIGIDCEMPGRIDG